MKRFYVKYENEKSIINGKIFLVREIEGEPYHYFISDCESHIGGGRLLRKYCKL